MYRIFMSRKLGGQSFNPYHFKYKVFFNKFLIHFVKNNLNISLSIENHFYKTNIFLYIVQILKKKNSRTKQYWKFNSTNLPKQ